MEHRSRPLTDNLCVFPNKIDEGVGGILEQADDVFVERVHVFHQPLIRGIIDATGVVNQSEVRVGTELGFLEFRMLRWGGVEKESGWDKDKRGGLKM